MAVDEHRLPDILRLQIAMLNKHAEQVAVSVARISAAVLDRTAAGGGHDSVASRRAACTAANRRLVRSRKPILGDLTIESGGHELQQAGTVWR